uniref:Uncharacterized protein n=1 Tax=Anopheles minimus TaxID=112268 RepID=A0A182WN53_9DIPT
NGIIQHVSCTCTKKKSGWKQTLNAVLVLQQPDTNLRTYMYTHTRTRRQLNH